MVAGALGLLLWRLQQQQRRRRLSLPHTTCRNYSPKSGLLSASLGSQTCSDDPERVGSPTSLGVADADPASAACKHRRLARLCQLLGAAAGGPSLSLQLLAPELPPWLAVHRPGALEAWQPAPGAGREGACSDFHNEDKPRDTRSIGTGYQHVAAGSLRLSASSLQLAAQKLEVRLPCQSREHIATNAQLSASVAGHGCPQPFLPNSSVLPTWRATGSHRLVSVAVNDLSW